MGRHIEVGWWGAAHLLDELVVGGDLLAADDKSLVQQLEGALLVGLRVVEVAADETHAHQD